MMTIDQATAVRRALLSMPKAAASSVGSPPSPDEMYVLPAHYSALNPDVSLVVGNRGMGKTFWAVTLSDDKLRQAAASRSAPSLRTALDKLIVVFGFAAGEGSRGVSSDALASFGGVPPEAVWRGVILSSMSAALAKPIGLREAVALAITRPDDLRNTLRRYDDMLVKSGSKFLILFDQLDHLADNWTDIQRLTKGLLKVALAMKSYRSIRLKIFMRSDQYADRDLFEFPDASKVRHEATMLHWYATDLYGLVYTWLWRDETARGAIMRSLPLTNVQRRNLQTANDIPVLLRASSEAQGAVFDELAGDQMGGGTKRGRPYSWIPTHLMDGMGEISPRSFLHALSVAAERDPESNQELAIDYGRIQEGVKSASEIRRTELLEDYPWIREALEPLHGMTVPAKRREILAKWDVAETPERILRLHMNAKAPVELVTSPDDHESRLEALERALEQIGVLQEREDYRINIPDIFRIAAGIKRMGGIKPQQRRQI